MKKKKTRRIVIVVAVLAGIVGAAFFYLCTGIYHADPSALGAMQPGGGVQVVETEQTIAFIPKNNPEGNALVFYPGAKVDADAYGPLARRLAEQSVLCVIVKMPFDLAILNANGAADVIDAYPEIKNWYVGGHSLGGVMASSYAEKDSRIAGVVFLASYPSKDLSGRGLRAISLTASEDGVLNREKYEQAKDLFPRDTVFHEIEGGNHSGFGSYTQQSGDGVAAIPNEEQQEQTVRLIAEWMKAA